MGAIGGRGGGTWRACAIFALAMIGPTVGCSSDESGGGGACNTIAANAVSVAWTVVPGNAPRPVGGKIVDGAYTLTALTLYAGDSGASEPEGGGWSAVVQVAGSKMQIARIQDGEEAHSTVEYGTTGVQISFTDTCPERQLHTSVEYSASPSQYSIYRGSDTGMRVETYSLR